jgi:hypothetical protein
VMNYPEDIKAFYMRTNDDGRTVAAIDVLAPGISEIIGGSRTCDGPLRRPCSSPARQLNIDTRAISPHLKDGNADTEVIGRIAVR